MTPAVRFFAAAAGGVGAAAVPVGDGFLLAALVTLAVNVGAQSIWGRS